MQGDVVGFIHAKGTSERVPNKNLRLLAGIPLFCHAVINAKKSSEISKVVIDSDSEEILKLGKQFGAIRLKRDKSLATNQTSGDELAFWQASNFPDSDIVAQIIPTSPFIRPETIDNAVQLLRKQQVNSVVGVYSEKLYLWSNGKPSYFDLNDRIPNSQNLPPTVYETTGLYINKTEFVLKNKRRIDRDNCIPIYLNKLESIDINTIEDFEFAELLMKGLNT